MKIFLAVSALAGTMIFRKATAAAPLERETGIGTFDELNDIKIFPSDKNSGGHFLEPSLDRELALSNAPLQEDGYFKVPRVLEE